MIAAIEYTDASQMLADYAARRARLYAPRPEPAPMRAEPQPDPEPLPPPAPAKVWTPVGSREARPWRTDEEAILRQMVAADRSARAIAKRLHRTATAIQIRARKLGLSATLTPRRAEAVKAALETLSVEPASIGGQARAIIVETAKSHGFTVGDILARCRNAEIIQARHHAMWLCARDTYLPYTMIGRAFGRDHTSILHAVRRVNAIMGANVRNAGLPR